MNIPINHVAELMPHSGKMMLLQQIIAYNHNSLTAYASIDHNHILVEAGQLPSWAALELMAQGVALWAGCIGRDNNQPVRLGFLLGTRKLSLYFDTVAAPATLYIKTNASLQDNNGFGVFDSELWYCDKYKKPVQLLAKAALNVYSPKDDSIYREYSNNFN